MRRLFLALVLLSILPPGLAESQPAGAERYTLEVKESQRITGVLAYNIHAAKLQASEWILFVPVAPELPGQTKVKTVLSPLGTPLADRSPSGRTLLRARVPARTADLLTALPIHVTYEATLRSRTLKPLPADAPAEKVAPLAAAERKAALLESRDYDFNQDGFQKWLRAENLIRQPGEGDLAFAKRAFLKLRSRLTYEYRSDLDRRASAVCSVGKSDCGGMSGLFVSVMRANGIPARSLYGRWAQSAKEEKIGAGIAYYQWHVKAEFYAENVGWVPVDMASSVLHDRSPEGLADFGKDRGDFLTMHVDPDLMLDTVHFGVKPVHNLQTPAWWATGKGTVDGSKHTEDWKVKSTK